MRSPRLLRPFSAWYRRLLAAAAWRLRRPTPCFPLRRQAERHVTEGTPHALECARVGVKHDDAQVAFVADEYFIGLAVHENVGGSVHVLRILWAGTLTAATDLQHQFPFGR